MTKLKIIFDFSERHFFNIKAKLKNNKVACCLMMKIRRISVQTKNANSVEQSSRKFQYVSMSSYWHVVDVPSASFTPTYVNVIYVKYFFFAAFFLASEMSRKLSYFRRITQHRLFYIAQFFNK